MINYDLPMKHTAEYTHEPEPNYEVYLHRVGSAGRVGRTGAPNSLFSRFGFDMLQRRALP